MLYKKRVQTKPEYEWKVIYALCDICQKMYYPAADPSEVKIQACIGDVYPDCDLRIAYILDCCPECFLRIKSLIELNFKCKFWEGPNEDLSFSQIERAEYGK